MNSGRRDQPALTVTVFWTLAAALLLAGCIDLAPQPDPTRVFVLKAPAMGGGLPEDGGWEVGIRRIDLPDYLLNPKMVVRREGFEIVHSEFNRWGENLDKAIGRVLGDPLRKWSFIDIVSTVPWSSKIAHDFEISIQIDRFEGIGRSAAQLDARWSITRGDSDDVLQVGYTSAKRDWNGSDYLALASALSDALATLAADIAGGLSAAE